MAVYEILNERARQPVYLAVAPFRTCNWCGQGCGWSELEQVAKPHQRRPSQVTRQTLGENMLKGKDRLPGNKDLPSQNKYYIALLHHTPFCFWSCVCLCCTIPCITPNFSSCTIFLSHYTPVANYGSHQKLHDRESA